MSWTLTHRPLHQQPLAIGFVALGGALGALARYGVAQGLSHGSWPWATLVVNLVGAFALGLLLEALSRSGDDFGARQRLRLTAGTGFCGAFTTYSTFAHGIISVHDTHSFGAATAWGAAQVVLGLICAGLGAWIGYRATPTRAS